MTEPIDRITESLQRAAAAWTSFAHTLTVQGAMAWAYQGDLDRARSALEALPADALQQVSGAAFALSSLADHVAESKAPQPS